MYTGYLRLSSADPKFPEIFSRRRIALGLSRRDVAAAVGVSETTAQSWENGTHKARGKRMAALARVLYMPEDQLSAETPLTIDIEIPMMFDVVGFLAKLDLFISTGQDLGSALVSLPGVQAAVARSKARTPKKTKRNRAKKTKEKR